MVVCTLPLSVCQAACKLTSIFLLKYFLKSIYFTTSLCDRASCTCYLAKVVQLEKSQNSRHLQDSLSSFRLSVAAKLVWLGKRSTLDNQDLLSILSLLHLFLCVILIF